MNYMYTILILQVLKIKTAENNLTWTGQCARRQIQKSSGPPPGTSGDVTSPPSGTGGSIQYPGIFLKNNTAS